MSSLVFSVSQGPGVYRHIRIGAEETVQALCGAIQEAYGIRDMNAPAFLAYRGGRGLPPVKYSRNNTKTTIAMRGVRLSDSLLTKARQVRFVAEWPAVDFSCRLVERLDEETEAPQVIRRSGRYFDFQLALSTALAESQRVLLQKVTDIIRSIPVEDRTLMLDYIVAASQLYGLVPLSFVHELYDSQVRPVDRLVFELHCLMLAREDEPTIQLLDEQLQPCDGDGADGKPFTWIAFDPVVAWGALEHLHQMQQGKAYYRPGREELLRYRDPCHVERTPQHRALINLLASLKLDRPPWDEIVKSVILYTRIGEGDGLQMLLGSLEERGYLFDSEWSLRQLMRRFADFSNTTRLYANCGYTPEEMIAMTGRSVPDNILPFPPPRAPGQPLPGPTTPASKPGRNSPCPCGSGKKYKHCCGKAGG